MRAKLPKKQQEEQRLKQESDDEEGLEAELEEEL